MSNGPVNTALQTANSIINFAAFKLAAPLIKTAMRGYMTWLNWPIVSTLFNFFFDRYYTKYFYIPIVDYTDIVIIKLQTDSQRNAYADVEGALHKALQLGDENAIKNASDAFDAMAKKLIHFDGFAS